MTTAEQCGNCIQETASAHYFAERHHLQNAEQMYPASAICAQLSAELDDARAQTASLRSQLSACQRENERLVGVDGFLDCAKQHIKRLQDALSACQRERDEARSMLPEPLPKEWAECDHHWTDPRCDGSNECLKCGMPVEKKPSARELANFRAYEQEVNKWSQRAEATEQQLQGMKEALIKVDEFVKMVGSWYRTGNMDKKAIAIAMDKAHDIAARALVSGKG